MAPAPETIADATSTRGRGSDPEAGATGPEKLDTGPRSTQAAEEETTNPRKKPVAFYFAFLSLVIMVLIVSLDSTALAVAIPVRSAPALRREAATRKEKG